MNETTLNNPKDGQLKMPFLLRPVILTQYGLSLFSNML